LPKSSVSRSIAQLEEDLGVRLLHRTTRKLRLTDAGTVFHSRVSRALADIDEATSAASDLQRELRGSIRLTAPVDLGVWAIASVVARFIRRYPGVSVEVRLSSRIVDLVAEGFDLAVRAGPIHDDSLVARPTGCGELGLYASPKYFRRRAAPATLAELAQHDCMVLRTDKGTLEWKLTSSSGLEQIVEARGTIAADDISFLKKATLAGAGVSLLPTFFVGREERAGKLIRLFPDWRLSGSAINVVYPAARYVPQRVIALRDFLVRELADLGKRSERHGKRARRDGTATNGA